MKLFISSTLLLLESSAMKTKIFLLTHNDFLIFCFSKEKRKKNPLGSRLNTFFVWTKNWKIHYLNKVLTEAKSLKGFTKSWTSHGEKGSSKYYGGQDQNPKDLENWVISPSLQTNKQNLSNAKHKVIELRSNN